MRHSKTLYIGIIAAFLAVYYLFCAIYLNKLGYTNAESLFYIEKAKIVFDGIGNRIKVMGLTSPILPFYIVFIFTSISYSLAPVIASAVGTAALFSVMASTLVSRFRSDFYLFILVLIFLIHPGILYVACSGKGVYLSLIFFFLFFLNILKFYKSNTTFHVSIASICLVILVFCDYKFIWLTLFFIPLVLSIAIQSLNLSEKESIFRLFLSFNSPSLRRKLMNKTFALYIILFILPIASIVSFKLLNLTHANDLNYFIESPYATWNVLADRVNFDQVTIHNVNTFLPHEVSLLVSAKILLFCPMIFLAIYLFRDSTYQILTILTPFALVEFLHVKYDKVFLSYEYYLIFLILALLCIMTKAQTAKNENTIKVILLILTFVQIYTGYVFLASSMVYDEKNFITMLFNRTPDNSRIDNNNIAYFINTIPAGSKILMDDAIAYPIVANVNRAHIRQLTMPYQDEFLSAIEGPDKYDDYILIATSKNITAGYSQLNEKYITFLKQNNSALNLRRIYEGDNWILYQIFRR